MKLIELQLKILPWVRHNFPDENLSTALLGLCEEVGEAARCQVKATQGIRGTEEQWMAELRKEIGDVVIKAAHVCIVEGWSLDAVVRERWDVVKQRDFVKDRQGHGLPTEEAL